MERNSQAYLAAAYIFWLRRRFIFHAGIGRIDNDSFCDFDCPNI